METGYPEAVDHPGYYGGESSAVECIDIVENMNFCRGNAIKYLWRAGGKHNEIEDLYKAKWYIEREISRLERIASEDKLEKESKKRPSSP